MKKLLLCLAGLFALPYISWSQCTPFDCSAGLPAYGGVCDTLLMDGNVNQPYSDSESFVLTDNCFDAGLIDPGSAGNNIRITNIDNFTFGGLPSGITVVPNQSSYSPPSGGYIAGCALFSGTPTDAGLFYDTMYFLADVQLCGFFPINQYDNPANYVIWMTVFPDPSFTGLAASYCVAAAPSTLTATGTTGGTFSGPGVTGSTFDPSIAGVGTHTIWYVVSAQEGLAVAPATDSSSLTVTVTSGTTYYVDGDGDGYGAGAAQSFCANPGAGYVTNNTDCNDADDTTYPGAPELCDGVDNNCNSLIDDGLTFTNYYVDGDGDGYGAGAAQSFCANPGAGYVTNNTDCNDAVGGINPGATEVCDGVDNNCNSLIDDGLTFTNYYVDGDGDGYGAGAAQSFCANPGAGYVTNNTDCNDLDDTINPGAPELCDGVDNNCNSLIDDGLTFTNYYVDGDGDGYGAGAAQSFCANPGAGYVTNNTDCNDTDGAINPGATEVCDGVDNNCNSLIDDGLTFTNYYVDGDGDGYGAGAAQSFCANPGAGYVTNNTDCNDADDTTYPGAPELCDGVDNNCNSIIDDNITYTTYYVDGDTDGYGDINDAGTSLCTNPGVGYSTNNTDCNDADGAINPGATEVCDGVDNNCNSLIDDGLTFTTYYVDGDTDGYGDINDAGTSLCTNPGVGYSTNNTDCNDVDGAINPGATEVCDGVDNNCNSLIDDGLTFTNYYVDGDGDGYGAGAAQSFCANPGAGYVTNNTDCNDLDDTINPGAPELCDGVDNNCNSLIDDGLTFTTYYVDSDGDSYGDGSLPGISLCANPGAGYATNSTDCNDANSSINPGATEICDSLDNDCNFLIDDGLTFSDYYVDGDDDGYGDENDPGVSLCANPGSGYATTNDDCDDTDNSVYPGATEIIGNGIDENCDGVDGYLDLKEDGFSSFVLFPNPSSSIVTITGEKFDRVTVSDLAGKTMLEFRSVNNTELHIDIETLTNGVYLVHIKSELKLETIRFIKQ